jgi:hypothetical protein
LAYWLSFQAMLNAPNEESWHALACALNIALILSERGFGADYEEDIKLGQEALMRALGRHRLTGSWALDGAGIVTVRRAIEVHDQQMCIADRAEIRKAINEVHRRVTAGETLEVS